MREGSRINRSVLCFTNAALLAATLAAQPGLAQTTQETVCRTAIGKGVTKYVKTLMKTAAKCHAQRDSGAIDEDVDCNDPGADLDGKLTKARAKLGSAVVSRCVPGGAPLLDVLSNYGRCLSPGHLSDDGGATDGIDDFSEVAACMTASADGVVRNVLKDTMGLPDPPLSSDAAACHRTIAAGLAKALPTIVGERVRCQTARDKAGSGMDYGCEGEDPKGKIQDTLLAFRTALATGCNVNDDPLLDSRHELDALQSCGDSTSQLQSCVVDVVTRRSGSGLAAMAYELPDNCPIDQVVRRLNGGPGEQLTETFLSTGWSGTAHNVDLPDVYPDPARMVCDRDCASCQPRLELSKENATSNCRCVGDPTIFCDTINAPDVDDCGAIGSNVCACLFGPPLPLSSGGIPVCVMNRIIEEFTGTADIGNGVWDASLEINALIHTGGNTLTVPCPLCNGDDTPNDGIRGGTCSAGQRPSQPCDQNSEHPTFGPISFDCPPHPSTNIGGAGIHISQNYTTAAQSNTASLPCDDPVGAMCHCRACSGDTTFGCKSNQECSANGLGTCTAGGGAGVEPNACEEFQCGDDGYCTIGPIEKFCDGDVRANGRGYLTCLTDAECEALNAGSCTLLENRACYPASLSVDARSGHFGGTLSNLFCIAASNSPAINSSSGLPGPGVVALNVEFEPVCATDHSIIYNFPGGSNCPDGPLPSTTTTTIMNTTTTLATTTTTIAGTPCGDSFPVCNGTCGGGQGCALDGLGCICS
ncbi:MAG TPA: hypothetical protein VEL28_01035 [Candidatus Binatia bacterium]|nr:hypothetical protein [Candidatus Binatia bacterium]